MTAADHSAAPPVSAQVAATEAMNQRIRERRTKGGTKSKTVSSESVQDYETPQNLIDAVICDFANIVFDLAASKGNAKKANFFSIEDDALKQDWVDALRIHQFSFTDSLWLNPPFANVRPWMEKCRDEAARGARILSLTKSSLDANWYQEVVAPNAASWILKSRVKFVGCDTVFTQALMLTEWGTGKRGLGFWDWKRK